MIELDKDIILKTTTDLNIKKKVGYILIIGRPNVGKSSFLNSLIQEKVSIVSRVPQTTRKKIIGIYNDKNSQLIFLDTAGVHISKKLFNTELNNYTIKNIKNSDVILYFIDSTRNIGEEEKYINGILKSIQKPVIKVYTKLDLKVIKDKFQISSITKEGFNQLLEKIKSFLTVKNILYPEDYYTIQDISTRISEVIREKLFLNFREELPHSIYVHTDEIEEKKNIFVVNSYIYTESDSQKIILIGKKGAGITNIGKNARKELENIFNKKFFLKLRVKVNKKWKKNKKLINKILCN